MTRAIPSTGEKLPAVGLGTWETFDVGPGPEMRRPLVDVLARFVGRGELATLHHATLVEFDEARPTRPAVDLLILGERAAPNVTVIVPIHVPDHP